MTWTAAHWHLLLNHLPILGGGFVLLLLLWGLARRSREVTRLALWLTLPLAPIGFAANQTGEAAEDGIRETAWFDRDLVHEHEERGETAVIFLYATAAVGALALWRTRRRADERWPAGVTALVLATATALSAWTGLAGGVIRHDEIRPPASTGAGG